MERKYKIGQRVRVNIDRKQAENTRYTPFLSYHGKRGTVVALSGTKDEGLGESQIYEVRLDMSGNVILTAPKDVLVAVR